MSFRRSTRIRRVPQRFRFSSFAKKSPRPAFPVLLASRASSLSAIHTPEVSSVPDECPLEELKRDLVCRGGFAVMNDYDTSDENSYVRAPDDSTE
jgi:hypothetical protein